MLSMMKGVLEFDSVQNQEAWCLLPPPLSSPSRRLLSLNKETDKLENNRALVDRKREKDFVMLSSHFPLHTRFKHLVGENKSIQKPTYLCTAVFQGDIDFVRRYVMLCRFRNCNESSASGIA